MKSIKLKDRSGYMLFESLIALAMVSISLYVLMPHSVQFFATLKSAGAEVAYWRVAQEQMQVIAKGGSPIGSQASGGILFTTAWDPDAAQLVVSGSDGAERVTVRAEEIQAEGP
ncbi:type II secretion system protein [uncultured Trichococcus sp.]|uniref:type II secretion system protein n=1 Tax=uncultured Trichococcus sp. TaxID=189665 RepID=UPI002A18CB2E|nr:type II secretion system protein [uncultured Trichococcus sp.]